jgi:murein DD-endopeptidase MepM/ murein hydrolase activator NlpD
MPNENIEGKKPLMQRLKTTYRLVVMNHETFEEIRSFKLSLLNVYVFLSTLMVAVALLVASLIVLTPLKRYIPGFGDLKEYKEVMRLSNKVDELEDEIKAHQTYTDNFRRMLTSDVETEKEVPKESVELPDSAYVIKRIPEDEKLRQSLEVVSGNNNNGYSQLVNVSPKDVPLSQFYFIAPLVGEVSKAFDSKKHPAIDVLAPKDTPVKAIMDGYVVSADWSLEFGNTIALQHSNNILTFYKHNSTILKKSGSFVKAGEAIAIIGNTGELSSGPHLHFELWHKGKPINPAEYIKFN